MSMLSTFGPGCERRFGVRDCEADRAKAIDEQARTEHIVDDLCVLGEEGKQVSDRGDVEEVHGGLEGSVEGRIVDLVGSELPDVVVDERSGERHGQENHDQQTVDAGVEGIGGVSGVLVLPRSPNCDPGIAVRWAEQSVRALHVANIQAVAE